LRDPSEVRGLVERLSSEDRATQRSACHEAIERVREEPELLREIVAVLQEGTPHARFGAALVLFRSDQRSLRLLPALLEALELEDGDLRWSATHMLTMLGRMQGEVLPVLLHEAQHAGSARRRRMAVYVLRELAPERPGTGMTLLACLDDVDTEVRRAALSSLAKVIEPDSSCVDRVLGILSDDPDPSMRRIAAVVVPGLVVHHPESRDAAHTTLSSAAKAADVGLRRAAEAALSRLPGAE
jgi:HEAT repeat protein